LQLIHDLEVEWKRINETWLIEQEKKNRKKKSRLEKSVEEEKEDDDDTEFIIDKFDDEEDFIPFEDENERDENASHTKNAKHAKHDNLRTNHSIDDELNPEDFFNDIDDERAFETLYN
jgi:hypothetical protein